MMTTAANKDLLRALRLFQELHKLFEPPPILDLVSWANSTRQLTSEGAVERGSFNYDKVPYLIEPSNCFTDPRVERIIIKGAARTGKSEALLVNPLGFIIEHDPGPVMIAYPGEDLIEKFCGQKLVPLLRDNPTVFPRVHKGGRTAEGGTNKMKRKTFDGGSVEVVNADIGSSFRLADVRYAFFDEVDAAKPNCQGEGSPVKLLIKRTQNAPNRKVVLMSSPTIAGGSLIEDAYTDSTREVYTIPCPSCGSYNELLWNWKKEETGYPSECEYRMRFRDASICCVSCYEYFSQWQWLSKSHLGKWVANNPGWKSGRYRGFWITGLVSPWVSWEVLVEEYREAVHLLKEGRPSEFITFLNTVLAELYEEDLGERLDEEAFFARREVYAGEIPEGVLLITAGVDTQDSWLAYSIIGWGKDHEAFALEAGVIDGDPADKQTWERFDRVIYNREWLRGEEVVKIDRTFIDSGGHKTDFVYENCRGKGPRLYPCRGIDGEGKSVIIKRFDPKEGKPFRYEVATDMTKNELATRLRVNEPGPAYFHFPRGEDGEEIRGFDMHFFKSLCGERQKEIIDAKGFSKTVWTRVRRNEYWDTFQYAYSALVSLGSGHALERAYEDRQELQRKKEKPKEEAVSAFGGFRMIPRGNPGPNVDPWGAQR
jgi:phage terminase large subunit GpA-like protein